MDKNQARGTQKRVVKAMKLVFDATPLIYFTRLGILDKVTQLKGEKIIPSLVYKEVVEKGIKKGKQDGHIIENAVKRDLFKVEKCNDNLLEKFYEIRKISKADGETLAIAKENKALAIIDESFLRTIAEMHGISYAGSIFILFKMQKENIIKKGDIKNHVDDMIRLGWRCSTELYACILEEINKL